MIVKTETRSTPWFGTYRYCANLEIKEASTLRRLDHYHIDHVIQIRKDWGMRVNPNWGGSWRNNPWTKFQITERDIADLHDLCDFLLQGPRDRRTTISGQQMFVYANDRDWAKSLCDLPQCQRLGRPTLVECVLRGTPGAVNLRSARHAMRTYLRHADLDQRAAETLRSWLGSQQDIRLGPALQRWVNRPGRIIHDYFFLDHDHVSTANMLALICPGLIRKTLPIVAAK